MKTRIEHSKTPPKTADDASLYDRLIEYGDSDIVPFNMPGHKRNGAFKYLAAAKIDITEVDGFDNLNDPTGVIADAQNLAADVFSAYRSRFLVNGSTAGILAAILGVARRGDKLLIARNCHKSVFNAAELAGAEAHFVYPQFENGFFGEVSANSVSAALDGCQGAKAVVITSPTYEGVISDIAAISAVCRSKGVLLIVDEAHGSHLGFGGFPQSARMLGADIVVNSLHKTLPSLTQTAILHICSNRVDTAAIDQSLSMIQTSSPSYPLMAAIDGCVRFLRDGKENMANWRGMLEKARDRLQKLNRIKLYSPNCGYDISKFTFFLDGAGISGAQFAGFLRSKRIEPEMAGISHLIAMSGAGDTAANLDRLAAAVEEGDEVCASTPLDNGEIAGVFAQSLLKPLTPINFGDINLLPCEDVALSECGGRISAEHVFAYPPGCPVILKGDEIDLSVVKALLKLREQGVETSSSCRDFPNRIRVIKA